MKFLTFSLCFVLSFQLFGQQKKKIKADNFISVQGGLLHDKHSDPSITGFNMINLGWSKAKDYVKKHINLGAKEFLNETTWKCPIDDSSKKVNT